MQSILSLSKSVSFNDLVEIRNVKRIIVAAIFLTCNEMISKDVYKETLSSNSTLVAKGINQDIETHK